MGAHALSTGLRGTKITGSISYTLVNSLRYFDMMLNNKYATAWTYYDRTMSMNVAWNSKLSPRNYSTCILFIPSEITMER
jgi:hypothetical protein